MRALSMCLVVVAACGPSVSNNPDASGTGDADPSGDASVCLAPDVLIVMDRTGTMHRDLVGNTPPDTPAGHMSAKLTQAIGAIDALVSVAGLDQTLRFGLSLFPQDPGSCITLSQRLQNVPFTNPSCQRGEIVIAPELGTGASIAAALDPATTRLCNTTPIGDALNAARDELARIKKPNVEQYIVLVTDGADFEQSCPTPEPLQILRDMNVAGIDTFVVGFGAQDTTPQGVNPPVLNRMACAGGTAKDFATSCQPFAGGGFDAVAPDGARVYFDAANSAELTTSLGTIARQICCGCVL